MPNYKCISQFKSFHGKLWKKGEMVGKRWYDCLEPDEKANFEFLNDFSDMPPQMPGLMTVPMDEQGSGEPYFIGFSKQKAKEAADEKERHIQEQVERLQSNNNG